MLQVAFAAGRHYTGEHGGILLGGVVGEDTLRPKGKHTERPQ